MHQIIKEASSSTGAELKFMMTMMINKTRVLPRWVDMINPCHHQWGRGGGLLLLKVIPRQTKMGSLKSPCRTSH